VLAADRHQAAAVLVHARQRARERHVHAIEEILRPLELHPALGRGLAEDRDLVACAHLDQHLCEAAAASWGVLQRQIHVLAFREAFGHEAFSQALRHSATSGRPHPRRYIG